MRIWRLIRGPRLVVSWIRPLLQMEETKKRGPWFGVRVARAPFRSLTGGSRVAGLLQHNAIEAAEARGWGKLSLTHLIELFPESALTAGAGQGITWDSTLSGRNDLESSLA